MQPSSKKKAFVAFATPLVFFIPALIAGVFYSRANRVPIKPGTPLPTFHADPIGGAPPLEAGVRQALICFSPDCPFCAEEFRQLDEMRARHSGWFSGASALHWALITRVDEKSAADFAAGSSLPVYLDAGGAAFSAFHVSRLPYLILVDDKGILQYAHSGILGKQDFEHLIERFYESGSVPTSPFIGG
jgi:hypothetical protein